MDMYAEGWTECQAEIVAWLKVAREGLKGEAHSALGTAIEGIEEGCDTVSFKDLVAARPVPEVRERLPDPFTLP